MTGRNNAIGRMFVVQKQVLVPGRSNKSKLAVESDGTAFLLYCDLILGMWYCFDVFPSRD